MKRLCLSIAIVWIASASVPAQKRFVDETFGYTVKTMKKWAAVPVEPTDASLIAARWSSDRRDRHGWGEMIVRFFRRGATGGLTTESPTEEKGDKPTPETLEELFRRLMARSRYTSYAEWCGDRRPLGKPTRFKGKAPSGVDVTANFYEIETKHHFVIVGVYTTEHLELAVELTCALEGKRKYRSAFKSVAKSLVLTRAPQSRAAAEAAADAKRGKSARERALAKVREDAARVKGWWFLESAHYVIVTNYPKRKKSRILDLQRRLEAIRKHFITDLPPVREIEEISIVRVCKDRKSYLQYGAPPASAGYWYAAAEELVIYMEGEKDFTRAVLNHEAFHQYVHYAARVRPHTWYNEGNADYYGGCEVQGSRLVSEKNRMRLDTIRGAIRAGTHVPLKEILTLSHSGYMARATLCYAQGWSLVYFLREGVPSSHPWAKIIPTYYRVLCEKKKASVALRAAFTQVDLEDFEKAWARFITRGDPVRS